MDNYYTLDDKTTAVAYTQMNNDMIKKMWKSFFLTQGDLEMIPCEEFIFRIGTAVPPTLAEGKEYAITVNENGVAIAGKDYSGLTNGFFALIMKIEQINNSFAIRHTQQQSGYLLQNRMIHICVFPENDLYFIKKLIRLSALCQYTHIVIEFWGMLKYDCMNELAWPQAFTKNEVRELICECNELGIKPIPMFNQLGHATASRVCYGKHVVLDQNPKLQRLFTPDGWAWNIESNEVKTLLKNIRAELYELFGEGEYMHVGCDEAYFISRNTALRKKLPHYLHELTCEVESEGRRPMIWMDMLLEKGAFKNCYTAGEKDEVEIIRNATAKSTIYIDWQYDCIQTPIPSLVSLQNCGKDIMGAPWFHPENYNAHIETVSKNKMFGIMLTTWHTLKQHMDSVLGCAKKCGASTFVWSQFSGFREETATLLRYVSFEGNSYHDSGWAKKQIEV